MYSNNDKVKSWKTISLYQFIFFSVKIKDRLVMIICCSYEYSSIYTMYEIHISVFCKILSRCISIIIHQESPEAPDINLFYIIKTIHPLTNKSQGTPRRHFGFV